MLDNFQKWSLIAMKNTWKDRTNLKRQIILERKNFYLTQVMSGELTPVQTEDVITKIVKCNEILFEMSVNSTLN